MRAYLQKVAPPKKGVPNFQQLMIAFALSNAIDYRAFFHVQVRLRSTLSPGWAERRRKKEKSQKNPTEFPRAVFTFNLGPAHQHELKEGGGQRRPAWIQFEPIDWKED